MVDWCRGEPACYGERLPGGMLGYFKAVAVAGAVGLFLVMAWVVWQGSRDSSRPMHRLLQAPDSTAPQTVKLSGAESPLLGPDLALPPGGEGGAVVAAPVPPEVEPSRRMGRSI
eukprot:RCo013171